MAYRVRVAKQGSSIYDDPEDQILDSAYPVFNAVDEGTGDGNDTIAHPMGVPTAFFIWTKDGYKASSYKLFHGGSMANSDGTLTTNVGVGVDYKYIITQRKLNNAVCSVVPNITGPQMVISEGANFNEATWDQVKFHSSKRTLQIWGRGATTITLNAVDALSYGVYSETSYAHGFSFTPAFMAFGKIRNIENSGESETFILDANGVFVFGGGGRFTHNYNIEACADPSKVWFRATASFVDLTDPFATSTVVIDITYIVIGAITV